MLRRPDPRAAQIAVVFGGASRRLRQQTVGHLGTTWMSMGSWRDADVARFTRAAVPIMRGAIRQQASITDAYLAALAKATVGAGSTVGVPSDLLEDLRGVPMTDVYRRPGVTTWTAVAGGLSWEAAAARGLDRLRSIASTDLQLARTHSARFVLGKDERVKGFRRVTSGACCELCDIASDQTYSTDDLMPIHASCNCDVESIFDAADPGDLSTGVPEEDDGDKPVVHEHGELGPVLAVAGQAFTGPDDLDLAA